MEWSDKKIGLHSVWGSPLYILVYPQGCDVCNHLSLFLCVANHDKLLPGLILSLNFNLDSLSYCNMLLDLYGSSPYPKTGWSHFAQFTIAVVNKDPKKSKYSGWYFTSILEERAWLGWKKFSELSKLSDGFIESDTLIIKAQVQVIR
ncbi:hypothetical protein Gotur_003209 [Gossypium turneri]